MTTNVVLSDLTSVFCFFGKTETVDELTSNDRDLKRQYHDLLLSGDEDDLADFLVEMTADQLNVIQTDLRFTANLLIESDNTYLRFLGMEVQQTV